MSEQPRPQQAPLFPSGRLGRQQFLPPRDAVAALGVNSRGFAAPLGALLPKAADLRLSDSPLHARHRGPGWPPRHTRRGKDSAGPTPSMTRRPPGSSIASARRRPHRRRSADFVTKHAERGDKAARVVSERGRRIGAAGGLAGCPGGRFYNSDSGYGDASGGCCGGRR